jgi:hypothetical protein
MSKFYGIVESIKDKHKSGVYGRKPLSKDKLLQLFNQNLFPKSISDAFIHAIPALSLLKMFKSFNASKIIELQTPIDDNNCKQIIIPNEALESNYSISGSDELFYGLFNNFTFPEVAFKTLMNSSGGSDLIIIERSYANKNFKHYGGSTGIFNTGLYTIHPKKNDILLPLANINELIKSFILEESIRAFEALGAKKITIEDITDINVGVGGSYEGINANVKTSNSKDILRVKEFGKGTFDPKRALNSLFLADFPNIMTVIDSRINGNQTLEQVKETINLSANIDVNVIGLYAINTNFNYKRTWAFSVEFYDKNELNK